MKVAVLGSANMDLVGTAASLPRPGETVLGTGFTMVAGGKGANQAVAATRAGAECVMVAAVGTDSFGQALRDGMAGAGIDTSLVREVPGASGVALIAVDEAGENQILVAPGASAALTRLTHDERAAIAAADALICQLEVPIETVAQAAAVARAAGVRVVVNAAPARPLPASLTRSTDLLVVNRGEAEVITGLAGAGVEQLLDALVRQVPRVVITLGAQGAVHGDENGTRLTVPAPTVSTVDTTAAGDAFIGALTVAWMEDRPMETALRWAAAAGAACVRTLGAATSLPVRSEIDALFAAAYPQGVVA
nr:ribokinase [uncultured Actinoplanes sp.]